MLDREFEEVSNGAAASAAGPSDTGSHIRGGHSALVRLLIGPSAITAQPPVEVFGFPYVDTVSVTERHLYQIDPRLSWSGRETCGGARPFNRAQISPD